jgi:hypothetical protein
MTTVDDLAAWRDANRAFVDAGIAEIRARLTVLVDRSADGVVDGPAADAVRHAVVARREAAARVPGGPLLDQVTSAFGLTPFERELVLLTLAAELDRPVADACAALQGPTARQPSFALAARILDGSHWSAITPGRPLRRAELVHLGDGPLPEAALTLDERLLHHLLGVGQVDPRLLAIAHHLDPCAEQTESIEAAAAAIDAARAVPADATALPVVRLVASVAADARLAVRRVATRSGDELLRLSAADLPSDPVEREHLARLWRREFVLTPILLLVELDEDPGSNARAGTFLDAAAGPVVVIGRGPLTTVRPERAVTLAPLGRAEQRRLWDQHLGAWPDEVRPRLDEAVGQFTLSASDVVEVATAVTAANGDGPAVLWDRCRARTRPALSSLAEHVATSAGWDDLVLADDDLAVLHSIADHVRHRAVVQAAWGFEPGARGAGISALFHGPSGTGKTLAAEVIANEVGLDLFRIDLSAVVDKYIGETEKNLRRIFDAAEAGGTVLLFDEADALFGKRSEVRDSHDRYANVEVSYLLQRMETYRGLAILTTNLRQALDAAFLRRLRFVVAFPFPDEVQRAELWRRVFPAGVTTADLEPERLARLGLSGASIRNVAVHASFDAAAESGPVRVDHVRRAAHREMAKLDKSLTRSEAVGLR